MSPRDKWYISWVIAPGVSIQEEETERGLQKFQSWKKTESTKSGNFFLQHFPSMSGTLWLWTKIQSKLRYKMQEGNKNEMVNGKET